MTVHAEIIEQPHFRFPNRRLENRKSSDRNIGISSEGTKQTVTGLSKAQPARLSYSFEGTVHAKLSSACRHGFCWRSWAGGLSRRCLSGVFQAIATAALGGGIVRRTRHPR